MIYRGINYVLSRNWILVGLEDGVDRNGSGIDLRLVWDEGAPEVEDEGAGGVGGDIGSGGGDGVELVEEQVMDGWLSG